MVIRILSLIAQFPIEGIRFRNWQTNAPSTFGSTLTITAEDGNKPGKFGYTVQGAGCHYRNTLRFTASALKWDYLHPARSPVFGVQVGASGCHARIAVPTGYRLAQLYVSPHPSNPNKIRVQMLARNFFGKEVQHEVVLTVRKADSPSAEEDIFPAE